MQRTVDIVVIRELINKYEKRADDCLIKYYDDKDILVEAQVLRESTTDISKWMDLSKEKLAKSDMAYMSAQLSVYECLLKDLKKLVGETNHIKTEEEVKEMKKRRMENGDEVR